MGETAVFPNSKDAERAGLRWETPEGRGGGGQVGAWGDLTQLYGQEGTSELRPG